MRFVNISIEKKCFDSYPCCSKLKIAEMDEVLAIWSKASDTVKEFKGYVPRLTWEGSPKDLQTISNIPTKEITSESLILPSDMPSFKNFVIQGSPFVRLAGISGAAAVSLGAYGAHNFSAEKQEMKKVYDTANFYHFVHTIALLAVPLSKRPALSGTLFLGGTTVFCGTIYYHALTENKDLRKYTPYGGVLLILGWLSMAL